MAVVSTVEHHGPVMCCGALAGRRRVRWVVGALLSTGLVRRPRSPKVGVVLYWCGGVAVSAVCPWGLEVVDVFVFVVLMSPL